LAKAIAKQKLYELIRQMKYKCEKYGITFMQVSRFFPSSKTCSSCGQIKLDLKLSDRIYKCDCGLEIDRDYNAALNLAKFGKLAD
jgi:putative transposase